MDLLYFSPPPDNKLFPSLSDGAKKHSKASKNYIYQELQKHHANVFLYSLIKCIWAKNYDVWRHVANDLFMQKVFYSSFNLLSSNALVKDIQLKTLTCTQKKNLQSSENWENWARILQIKQEQFLYFDLLHGLQIIDLSGSVRFLVK